MRIASIESAKRPQPVADSGKWPGYTSFLRRELKTNGDRVRLIAYAFGPSCFWVHYVYAASFLCIVILLSRFFVDAEKVTRYATSVGFAVLFISFPLWIVMPEIVFRTRREQELLSLTPNWPARERLNTWFARYIARQIFAVWIVVVVWLVVFALTYQAPMQSIVAPVLIGLLMATFACGYALMEYANDERPLFHERLLGFCALLLTLLSLGILVWVDGPVAAAIATLGTLGVIIATVRWRKFIGGSAALPAGRLAR
jgi:hypothetical protein